MKTLEEVIKENSLPAIVGSEFIVRVHQIEQDGKIHCYIRPNDRNGETFDFYLEGNAVIPIDNKPPTLGIHVQETVKPQDIFGQR